jgi:hypothetical protein
VLVCSNHLVISYVSLAGIGVPFGGRGTPVLALDFRRVSRRSESDADRLPADHSGDRRRVFSLALIAFILTLRAGR